MSKVVKTHKNCTILSKTITNKVIINYHFEMIKRKEKECTINKKRGAGACSKTVYYIKDAYGRILALGIDF